jgi:hypothetical protein
LELEDGPVARVTISQHGGDPANPIIGCGRDSNLSTALSRAYGETIERLAAEEFYKNMGSSVSSRRIAISRESLCDLGEEMTTSAPRRLRTSNGWAVHYSPDTAISNAANEAIERHLLIYSFLKNGWEGFALNKEIQVLGKRLTLLSTRYTIGGRRAGMALAKLANFPGFTTGYTCGPELQFSSGQCWSRAIYEAVEPASAIDNGDPSTLERQLAAKDPLQATQAHYALCGAGDPSFSHAGPTISLADEIQAKVHLIDLREKWSLPFPFYAAYVFSDQLIPLVFKRWIDECAESRRYVLGILSSLGLLEEFPNVHPVI